MNDVCKLISALINSDEIGNEIETEIETEVFCEISSVSQNEFFQAAQNGMKSSLKIILWCSDYDEQTIVKIDDKKYSVYRTFKNNDFIELYLQTKVGVD